nr:recombinase family protein [Desulfofalx alkaliphila]
MYRRVSTDMQAEEGFSLEAQRLRLQAYAESQGWNIVDDYCDEGFSAKNIDRPEMQRLIKDIKKKKFDVILVYRLDRFVRSVVDLHEMLQLMEKYDVKFKSATEVFDTTSATGRLFITLIATLAQWERETIAERVHLGMTKKAEQGERNGAPAPYGYDLVDGNLIVNKDEAKWVKYIFERYGAVGSQTLAKELNQKGSRTKKGKAWSDFSVRYVLRNPIYAGLVRWNYETFSTGIRKKTGEEILTPINQEGFVPLVKVEDFKDIQKLMASRSTQAFRSNNFYPFSGVAKCEKCGYPFTGAFKKTKNGMRRFYKCRGRFAFGTCDTQIIAEDVIEDAFLDALELAESELGVEPSKQTLQPEEIQKQLDRLKLKKERAEELYLEGDISKDRYTKIIEEIKQEEERLYSALDAANKTFSVEQLKQYIRDIKTEWPHFSYETKKQAVHSLFDTLTIRLLEKADPGKRKKARIKIVDYKLI